MANKKLLLGLLAMTLAFGFLLTGCGDLSSDRNGETGNIRIINNTNSRINVVVVMTNDPTPNKTPVTSDWIWANSDSTKYGIPAGREYYVAVTDFDGTDPFAEYNILYRSYAFTLEKGKTLTFTFNGWSLY